ncbi:probable pathogenesis-related protein CaO19.6200 [Harpegnathos saltator]|uniref:probable pathogenesis-related protein CaO19.6200 n=1 Tax=Harpegnathos saltator TaxID=610380 RepID=UPI00058AFD07|nr:probable pathogenesis-related protein CaO19.6200 [Harpegnathos saltator]
MMELREVNRAYGTAEETTELLPQRDNAEYESYFIKYAMQKEMINRNRCSASRRLLSQAAHLDFNFPNSNHVKESPCAGISMIHTSSANWPPSRKREEATALENLRKRVEQSKLYKADRIVDSVVSTTSSLNYEQTQQQLDNRPKLLKKILSNRPMSITHDRSDLETDWRDSEFITECLCWHNVYRQRHNAPPLTMSPQLCEYAQTWANHLAHTNTFYYRNDRNVGHNLYCRPGGAVPGDVTGQEVASYWYSAVRQYDFLKEPDVLHANVNAGHFTQLIWASSRYFGVGKARSRSGKLIVVANYEPVGNVSGQFQNNVLPPLPENMNVMMSPPTVRIPRGQYELLRSTAAAPLPPPLPPPLSDTASTGSDTMSVSSGQ